MEYSVQAFDNSVTGGTGKVAGTYKRGDLLIITCNPQDTWKLSPDLACNADGLDNHEHQKNPPNGIVINTGTMVGSLDKGNSFFPVGTLCELSITTDNTELQLFCWDSDKDNNSGAISAFVQSY
jgi:hypothetical protein